MNISSIAASAPVNPPDPGASKTPDLQPDDDASEAPPPVQAALPPGQGTRIDQIA